MAESLFAPLQRIGERTYLHEADQPPTDGSPALIILCTWIGGATPRRVNKYVSRYREIYPQTSILVITNTLIHVTLCPFPWFQATLEPARNAIRHAVRRIDAAPHIVNGGGILLHMFSHGGSHCGTQLAYSFTEEEDSELFFSNLKGIILDCSPGDDSFERTYNAASHGMSNASVSHLLGKALLYPTLFTINRLQHVGLWRRVADLRRRLNNPSLVPTHVPKLYLYSGEDPMVRREDVESHAQEARSLGYNAVQVLFDRGVHCGLPMQNPDRYWTAIQKFWGREEMSGVASETTGLKVRSRL